MHTKLYVLLIMFFVFLNKANADGFTEQLRFNGKLHGFSGVDLSQVESTYQKTYYIYESQVSTTSEEAFNNVIFNGIIKAEKWKIEIRLSDGEKWTDWQETEYKVWPNGRFWAKVNESIYEYRQIQYRLILDSPKDINGFNLYAVDVFNNQKQFDLEKKDKSIYFDLKNYRKITTDSFEKPDVVNRTEWQALPPSGTEVPHNPYRLTLHHTAMSRVFTLEDGITEMQFIQDYHMNTVGWKDIAYHYCIDDSGRIYEGVPDSVVGTHTGGANTGNIGVSMMGYFESETPPQAMLDGLIELYTYLCWYYEINPDSLLGHRDYVSTTTCPGSAAYAEMEEIRNEIRKNLADGAPYVTSPQPVPFSEEIEPNVGLSFYICDEIEGVDLSSIEVQVNSEAITPDNISGSPNEYFVTYHPAEPFLNSSTVKVDVYALDLSSPADTLEYQYEFKIKPIDVLTETYDSETLYNGTLSTTGIWTAQYGNVQLEGLQDGQMLYTSTQYGNSTARIYPNIVESGNYEISMAFNQRQEGQNVIYRIVNSNGVENKEYIEYNSTYENKWGKLGNGPVYFSSGTPSTGYLEILPASDVTESMLIDAFRFSKQTDGIQPAVPELKYVRFKTSDQIEVAWYPSLETGILGYRLYMSADGREWTEETIADEQTLSQADTLFVMDKPGSGNCWYFRVETVDSLLNEDELGNYDYLTSDPSDIYGVASSSFNSVLIVDNFDRRASWSAEQHFFNRSYGHALLENGVGFESCSNDAVEDGFVDLNDYDIVIYFCGDDATADEAVSALEMQKLDAFMSAGGKLLISGSEIGYDLGRSSSAELSNYNNILKASYLGDDSGIHECEGAAGSPFSELSFTYGIETEDTYIEDWPDYISAYGGSSVALYYTGSSRAAAIYFTGTAGKLFHMSFPWETIYPEESRTDVMKAILEYFDVETSSISENNNIIPLSTNLNANYPNPFNQVTKISYQIAENDEIELSVFNALGQKVITLVKGKKQAGKYEMIWDASNFASGMYICLLQTKSGKLFVQKMLLLK